MLYCLKDSIYFCIKSAGTQPASQVNPVAVEVMKFDDPSETKGSEEFVKSEFLRVRDEIRMRISEFYVAEIE